MGSGYGDVIKIINEDCTGRKVMRKTANADDPESVGKAFNSVIEKYGLDLKVVRFKRETTDNPWTKEEEEFKW